MTFSINRKIGILGFAVWWVWFAILSTTGFGNQTILNTISFLSLLIVPGTLTLIALKIKGLEEYAQICLVAAFSILEIMLTGLITNAILPKFGIMRPLDKPYILGGLSTLVAGLSIFGLFRNGDIKIKIRRYFFFEKFKETFFIGLPILFVFQSLIGALALNNGGPNTLTLWMLAEMTIYIVLLYFQAESLDEKVMPITLFLMSLALLLMTSMRGAFITGHDIQLEYKVFQLAKNTGFWTMSVYRDAYNACLSITILPTIFSEFLSLADQYIYKFLFQIIFAACAGLIYLTSRNWLGKRMSLLTGIYFIAFPTFFEDMPFLNRQEVAFLFYGLMIYLIFKESININVRRVLFVVMGIGVILSHYSTTYTILLIFGLTAFSFPLFKWILRRSQKNLGMKSSAIDIIRPQKSKITLLMIGILIALNFLWTSVITDSGGNVTKVVEETLVAAKEGFTENSRSTDAISLITFRKPDLSQQMADYVNKIVIPQIAGAKTGEFINSQLFLAATIKPLPEEKLPLTTLGRLLSSFKINVKALVPLAGELIAKLIEVASPAAILYLFWRKKIIKNISGEFVLIGMFYLLFIGANIVLPILSTEYGVFRAIQQSMFVLAPFVVIGSALLESKKVPIIITICFFAYSTALIPQLFGANSPQLHLNNTGDYYDDYVTHGNEIAEITWLSNNIHNQLLSGLKYQPDVQSDRFMQSKIKALTNLGLSEDIFPTLIRTNSYVVLGDTNVLKGTSVVLYNGDSIVYQYPIGVLDQNKNLIYNNGSTRIYK